MQMNLWAATAGLGLCFLGPGMRAQDGTAHAADGGTMQQIQSVDILPLEGASFTAAAAGKYGDEAL